MENVRKPVRHRKWMKREEEEENEAEAKGTVKKTCSHHTVTVLKKLVTMWKHMASGTCNCKMIAALGKIEQRQHKRSIMHCSMFHHEYEVTGP